jgi:hypothetical protein
MEFAGHAEEEIALRVLGIISFEAHILVGAVREPPLRVSTHQFSGPFSFDVAAPAAL